MQKKWFIIAAAVVVFIATLAWLYIESTKPLPGTKIDDLGRKHIPIGEIVKYNSNPPTSGSHYEDWIRAGVYKEQKDDRNLVHSLEHGYVVMSYRCRMPNEEVKVEEGTESAKLDTKEQCDSRKILLEGIYQKKGQKKLIVVPRANLDTVYALTAWNYLDKFNDFDQGRIGKFIDGHLDKGPEKTME